MEFELTVEKWGIVENCNENVLLLVLLLLVD